jgi:hypothetical protein
MMDVTISQSALVASKLVAAHRAATLNLPQESILASLQLSDMKNRQDRISGPSQSTHNWIFETTSTCPHPVTYMSWLQSGDGIFWIIGKAGSGKSTLMKHIYTDGRTVAALEQWANGRRLLTASHYFWYLESPMEKPYSGLLRSILYDTLDAYPDLIQPVCASRWSEALQGRDIRSTPWSDMELQKCLGTLITNNIVLRLNGYAGDTIFSAHLTLLASYVFLIKRASQSDEKHHNSLRDTATEWCTEALHHMQEVPARPSLMNLLYALDSGMHLLNGKLGNFHWSSYLVEDPLSYSTPPKLHELDVVEQGGRDLLGHLIDSGFDSHVEALLRLDPGVLRAKKGRPYLDYARRCKLDAPFRLKHPEQKHASLAVMELLLKLGCDVNEVVYVHGNGTVWDSYLYYIHYHHMNSDRGRKTAWLLVTKGAGQTEDRFVPSPDQRGKAGRLHDHACRLKPAESPEPTHTVRY